MVFNTRSVLFGLMLGAAQLSSALPSQSEVAFSTPIYPTKTDSIPPPASTDDCLKKCNDAHDKCNTAPDANHATCAAEYSECLGYNPYENGFVAPTACSAASSAMKPTGTMTSATSTASAPVTDDCVKKCDDAHDKCNTAPDANHATCAAEYSECLGYNPYENGFVAPTACSAATKMASSTPMPTSTESAVVVNGAGHISSDKIVGVVGAIGVAALVFL